jgi:hypothetical protein
VRQPELVERKKMSGLSVEGVGLSCVPWDGNGKPTGRRKVSAKYSGGTWLLLCGWKSHCDRIALRESGGDSQPPKITFHGWNSFFPGHLHQPYEYL